MILDAFLASVQAVIPVFLIVMAGYLAKRVSLIREQDIFRMNKLMFTVFLPTLIYYNIYQSDFSSILRPKILLFFSLGLVGAFSLGALFTCLFVKERSKRGVIIHALFRSNFSIIGLPIINALVDKPDMAVPMIALVVGVPITKILGVTALEFFGGQKMSFRKTLLDILKNPLIIACLLSILTLALGIRLPRVVESAVGSMSRAASPMLLFLLGAFFRFDGLKEDLGLLVWANLGRLVLIPAVFLGLAALFGLRGVEMATAIGMFATSAATSTFTMAQQMGSDAKLAGNIVVTTSFFCSFTLLGWCFVTKLLGLV